MALKVLELLVVNRPPRHTDGRKQFMVFFQESCPSPIAVGERGKQGRLVHCLQDGQRKVKFLATIVWFSDDLTKLKSSEEPKGYLDLLNCLKNLNYLILIILPHGS